MGTTQRVVEVINREMGGGIAQAVDGRLIRVHAPDDPNARVAVRAGRIENLEVRPMKTMAKVIVNPRTGSVVMNQTVTIETKSFGFLAPWSSKSVVRPLVRLPDRRSGLDRREARDRDDLVRDVVSLKRGAGRGEAQGAPPLESVEIVLVRPEHTECSRAQRSDFRRAQHQAGRVRR